jgi:hypothetical protein
LSDLRLGARRRSLIFVHDQDRNRAVLQEMVADAAK